MQGLNPSSKTRQNFVTSRALYKSQLHPWHHKISKINECLLRVVREALHRKTIFIILHQQIFCWC